MLRRPIAFLAYIAVIRLTLCAVPASGIGTTAPSWEPRETVATGNFNASFMGDHFMAFDHYGNPAVAFYQEGVADLRYARYVPGSGWVNIALDTTGFVGGYPSLAFDRYERAAISYYDITNGNLKYARFTGTSWQLELVDSAFGTGSHTSLAFDLLGRPAIAYRDEINTSLKYVSDTDGDFSLADETPVTVVNQFDEGHEATLAFDPLNRPMIAHFDMTNEDVRFSIREHGNWATATIDSAGSVGWDLSLAIVPDNGFPAIAYMDRDNFTLDLDLRYAVWDGDAWNFTTVDASNSTFAREPSLAFDPADSNPAITYSLGGDLGLAWHDGSTWRTQAVDTVGNVGSAPSIAFNQYGNGFPSIAYFTGVIPGSLFFIQDPPATVPETATFPLIVLAALMLPLSRCRSSRRAEPRPVANQIP